MSKQYLILISSLCLLSCLEKETTPQQTSWDFFADATATWTGEAIYHRTIDGFVEEGFVRGPRTFSVQQSHDQDGTLRATYWQELDDWGGGWCRLEGTAIPSAQQLSFDIAGSSCLWIDDSPGGETFQAEERWVAQEGSLLIATELNGAESAGDWKNYYAWSVRATLSSIWHQFESDSEEPGLVKVGTANMNQDGYLNQPNTDFGDPQLPDTSCPNLDQCWTGTLEPTIIASDGDETCEAARDWLADQGHGYVTYTFQNEGKTIYKPDTSQTINAARRFDSCTTTFIDGYWLVRANESSGQISVSRDGADHFQNVGEGNYLVYCAFRFSGDLEPCD